MLLHSHNILKTSKMLVNDLGQMIDSSEEGKLVYETNGLGRPRKLYLRYRPPGEGRN